MAELIAFNVLNPVMRSRQRIRDQVKKISEEEHFIEKMKSLFEAEATGRLVILTLQDVLDQNMETKEEIEKLN